MSARGEAPGGVALLCDGDGTIVEVVHDGLALAWKGGIVLVHCGGVVMDDRLLVLLARTRDDVRRPFDEMMRMNTELAGRLRQLVKETEERPAVGSPETESHLFDELSRLNNELARAQRELSKKNAALERMNREMQTLTVTDSLTDCLNRRGLFDVGEREVARARRYGGDLSLLVCDIDHFKSVNDTHGHATGDAVLVELVARWRKAVREVDVIARNGGDEFVILLPGSGLDAARPVAERVRAAATGEPIRTESGPIETTISVGVCSSTPEVESFDDLLRRADRALYRAKEKGRNRIGVLED